MPHAHIDLTIHISGLCLVVFEECGSYDPKKQRGPGTAGKARLLMVPTASGSHHPRHHPRLSYYLEDDLAVLPPREGVAIEPSPEGRSIVHLPLEGRMVDFAMPYDYGQQDCTLCWQRPPGPDRVPGSVGEDPLMDWLLVADEIGLEEVAEERAAAMVRLPPGDWACRSVFRNREITPNDPVRWRIRHSNGQKDREMAIATSVVLTLRDLRFAPRIRICDLETEEELRNLVLCGSPDDPSERTRRELTISFSNTPDRAASDPHSHVRAYQALAAKGVVADLMRADDVATSTGPPCDTVIKY